MEDIFTSSFEYNAKFFKALEGTIDNIKDEITKQIKEEAKHAYISSASINWALSDAIHLYTMNFLSENYDKIILKTVIESANKTKEYSYEPYLVHLIGAININMEKLITMEKPSDSWSPPGWKIDFSPLGTVDEWAAIVDAIRKLIQLKRPYNPSFKDIGRVDLASKKWKEYYQADREGGDKKYSGKYANTVALRLALTPKDKAPFWYLIEHGNASNSGMPGDGIPYPKFAATDMQKEIRTQLSREFHNVYRRYKDLIQIVINQLPPKIKNRIVAADIEAEERSRKEAEIRRKTEAAVVRAVDEGITSAPKFEEEIARKTIAKITEDPRRTYELYYSTRGNLFVRGRDRLGRFTKVWMTELRRIGRS